MEKIRTALLAPAGILLAAFLAFGLTLKTGFLWDDHRMIEQNPRLEFTASNLAAAFRGDPFSQGLNYYRPLQTVSNMADFAAWGYRPFGYHLTNFLFHAASALLFFYLVMAMGLGRGAAFWAAALLAAHPAAVEQMLVIAGRAELASAACTLASLLLLVKGRTAVSFIFFIAAAGFKENGVVTPALGALCLWLHKPDRPRRDYLKLLPFFAFIPLYLYLRHQALGMDALAKGWGPLAYGLFFKVPVAITAYLRETVLPYDMHSHRLQPDLAALRHIALPVMAGLGIMLWRRGSAAALFCAGWYLLNLAPKMPLLATNDLMLDHWVYLANAGLFLGAALAARGRGPAGKTALAGALLLFTAASAANIPKRNTDLKIYEHAARLTTSKPMLYNLAREYYLLGRVQESRDILEGITAQDPGNQMYLNGLALARWRTGDVTGALKALDAAQAAKPGSAETLYNRYCVLAGAGRLEEAVSTLAGAVKADPYYAPALLAVARLNSAAGRRQEAKVFYSRILQLNPYDLEALNDYGIILAMEGNKDGARELFLRALKVSPGLQSARQNLAHLDTLNK